LFLCLLTPLDKHVFLMSQALKNQKLFFCMGREEKIQLIAGFLFIILILLGIVLALQIKTTKTTQIDISKNLNFASANVIEDYMDKEFASNNIKEDSYVKNKIIPKEYSSWGKHTKSITLGLYSDNYEVNVKFLLRFCSATP
jgi:hypothetical protein